MCGLFRCLAHNSTPSLQRLRHWSVSRQADAFYLCIKPYHLLLEELPLRPGADWCEDGITLNDVPQARLSLSCGWSTKTDDDEPWYLLSDLPSGRPILSRYVGRFSIEEMFRDFKEQGFRLEKTRLRDPERVSRLALCVCLAYVFALLLGEQVIERGEQKRVQRSVKSPLSLFQTGLRYLRWLLVRQQDWIELLALRI